jgi:hypothetical protein
MPPSPSPPLATAAAVAFTVGLLFAAAAAFIANPPANTSNNGNSVVTAYCSGSLNSCQAVVTTLNYIAAALFLSFLLPVINIVLTAVSFCRYNAIVAVVSSLGGTPGGGGVTVVMMPAGMSALPTSTVTVGPGGAVTSTTTMGAPMYAMAPQYAAAPGGGPAPTYALPPGSYAGGPAPGAYAGGPQPGAYPGGPQPGMYPPPSTGGDPSFAKVT